MTKEIALKPRTLRLLSDLHSRREFRNTLRKDAEGFWIFSRPRVRTVFDYERIAKFPRAPKAARELVERKINRMLSEARRFEARYGQRCR